MRPKKVFLIILKLFKNRFDPSRFKGNYGQWLLFSPPNFNIVSLLLTTNPALVLYYYIIPEQSSQK